MKRLCIFAHWDKDNIVDGYVVYYLKSLKEICDTIIFVSDTDCSDISLIENIVDYFIVGRHGEYDFGSYKRGFNFAKENGLEFDELLFVNDSCYGPLYSLVPIFEKMEKKKCDWWGLTLNNYGVEKYKVIDIAKRCPNIQSYFMVFYPNVFNSNVFTEFINSISVQPDKNSVIIKYEEGLSRILNANGFKSAVYFNKYKHTENCLISKWKQLIIKYHFPFLKTGIIKNGIYISGAVKDWKPVIEKYSDYPVELISDNASRYETKYEDIYAKLNLYRKIRFRLLNNLPMEVRFIVILLEKSLFAVLNTICFNKLKKF